MCVSVRTLYTTEKHFRMSKDKYNELCNLVLVREPKMSEPDSRFRKIISKKEKMAVTLSFVTRQQVFNGVPDMTTPRSGQLPGTESKLRICVEGHFSSGDIKQPSQL